MVEQGRLATRNDTDLQSEDTSYSQFPEGTRIERSGNSAYIYNERGDMRWFIQDFVMDWENKRHMNLELQGETRGGSWHLMMGAYQAIDVDTLAIIESGVNVDAIEGDAIKAVPYPVTPNRNLLYSDRRNGKMYEGWQTGHYGERGDLESDLISFGAQVINPDDAPEQVDVHATMQRLAETFQQGSFEVPEFVISEPEKERLPDRKSLPQRALASAQTVFRRLK